VNEMKKILLVVIALMLYGCAVIDWIRPEPIIKYETIEIKVPIYMKPTPPDILLKPPEFVLPVFVGPRSEWASSALTVQGEAKLKRILLNLYDREKAWREWSR
jgi:hypothetical protein